MYSELFLLSFEVIKWPLQVFLAFPESQKLSIFSLDDRTGLLIHLETHFFFLPNCLSITSQSQRLTFINDEGGQQKIVIYNLLSR